MAKSQRSTRKRITVEDPTIGDKIKIFAPAGPDGTGWIVVRNPETGDTFRVENPHGAAVRCSVHDLEHIITGPERDELGGDPFVCAEALEERQLDIARRREQALEEAEAKRLRRSDDLQQLIDEGDSQ